MPRSKWQNISTGENSIRCWWSRVTPYEVEAIIYQIYSTVFQPRRVDFPTLRMFRAPSQKKLFWAPVWDNIDRVNHKYTVRARRIDTVVYLHAHTRLSQNEWRFCS